MYEYKGIVSRVVDGDTVDLRLSLGFMIKLDVRIRLLGVDAPEVRGEEKIRGKLVSKILTRIILGKEITVQTEKTGKYGRWLGIIMYDGQNCNDLIEHLSDLTHDQLIEFDKEQELAWKIEDDSE